MARLNRLKLIILFSLCRLALPSSLDQVLCSSSYIDDFFLPTAKIALNKIQQSFNKPSAATSPTTFVNQAQADETTTLATQAANDVSTAPDTSQIINSQPTAASEPDKNEFVKVDVGSEDGVRVLDVSAGRNDVQKQPEDSEPLVEISSTEATSEDPSEATTKETVTSTNDILSPAQSNTDDRELRSDSVLDRSASKQADTDPDDSSKPTRLVKPSEEAIRETELEAIAAVDASIGFGDSSSSSSWFAATSDACYDEYGNARYCEPEFENVALERQLEVSSECGNPPSRFCTTNLNGRNNDQIRNCHICDLQHPKKRHPAASLTDVNDPRAPTCWVSAPIGATSRSLAPTSLSGPTNPTNASTSDINKPEPTQDLQRDNVTITVNLDKRYEITYVSLQFCSLRPDSLAIWKSVDFGKSWSPYQFYSSLCSQLYGRPALAASELSAGGGGRLNAETGQVEAVCVNSSSLSSSSANAGRVTFSTTLPGGGDAALDRSADTSNSVNGSLSDWLTATNIKIVLDRHQASWIQSSLGHAHHYLAQRSLAATSSGAINVKDVNMSSNDSTSAHPSQRQPASLPSGPITTARSLDTVSSSSSSSSVSKAQDMENSLTNPSDTYNYAISDLTVGGRCKCNGHASRCIHNPNGRLQCDCQHNTDGVDCEKCLPLHHDRPWQRATQANANPCQPCNCNGHSRKCRFDPELYLLSGKRSGGVCIDCKDNTTGRHCNYCKEGFTRDHTRPMSDQGACKLCDCHPVGSLGKTCNHLTGQCPCKEGVTGLECNRCAPGYQQSSSPTEPCIKLPENDINYEPSIEVPSGAEDEPALPQVVDTVVHQPDSAGQEPSLDLDSQEPEATRPTKSTPSPAARPPAAVDSNQIDPVDEQAPPERPSHSAPRSRPHWPKTYPFGGYPTDGSHQPGESQINGGVPMHARGRSEKPTRIGNRNGFDQSQLGGFYGDGGGGGGGAKYYQLGYRQTPYLRNLESLHPGGEADGGYETGYERGYHSSVLYPAPDGLSFTNDLPHQTMLPPAQQPQLRTDYPKSRYHWNRHQNHQQPSQPAIGTPKRHRIGGGSSSSCTNCVARIKRLNSRQFCHLDYAIRARVLSRRASSSWTKYEVEIQDIFKSPSSSALLLQRGEPLARGSNLKSSSSSSAHQIDARSDDPNASPPPGGELSQLMATTNQSQLLAVNEQQANTIPEPGEHPIHKLRIGGVQWIWVPTEDVDCKCPRLRLHSSYLLMGLVDAHEHSTASIQLDRHGVSMVWRPSLQEKLIKYQRLQSDGLCWRPN